MNIELKDIAKALGSLAASLTEATGSEMGMVILAKDKHIGVFMGGDNKKFDNDNDKIVVKMRAISKHLGTLADSIASGKLNTDGVAYAMDEKGTVVPLNKNKKPSTGEPDISLLQ